MATAASGGHSLLQQRAGLANDITGLVNDTLKKICRAHGYQVSGTKAVLVTRCLEALDTAIEEGNVRDLEDIKYRMRHSGYDPPAGAIDAALQRLPQSSYQSYNMAQHRGGRGPPPPSRSDNRKYFKSSAFYEVLETLVPLQDLPEMPQNRHTVKANLTIKPELAQQFRNDPSLKIIMYCGLTGGMSPYSPADVAFPSQIEVKVGDSDVKANFKGLKNKIGSTKPADITTYVRKYQGQTNLIQVTYALTTKRYAFTVHLVRYNSADKLVERIKKQSVIRKQSVLDKMRQANADPDIAATSFRMSLKDPISTLRITVPVRSSHCSHNQCFDGAFFMQLQEQAPQWSCPVCSKVIPFESLCVDEYFQEILDATTKSTEKIDIEPDGQWKVIREDEDENGNTTSKPRADYDDDFDDDIVEVEQPGLRQSTGSKRDSQSLGLAGRPSVLDTPPLSSREASVAQSASSAPRSNKRPASAVIDLTLSDEEEEQPVRAAKRQHTSTQPRGGSQSNAYNTPTSLPDIRLKLPQRQNDNAPPPQRSHHSDNYRQGTGSVFSNHNSINQASPYNTTASMSPPPRRSPIAFGQPSIPTQHSRPPLSSHGSAGQPFTNNSPSNYNNNHSGSSVFPPNSPFSTYRPPSQHSFHQQQQPQQPQDSNSPAPQQHSRLKLPPMPPPPQQQQHQYPFSGSQQYDQNVWGNNGNDYGFYGSSDSPAG